MGKAEAGALGGRARAGFAREVAERLKQAEGCQGEFQNFLAPKNTECGRKLPEAPEGARRETEKI